VADIIRVKSYIVDGIRASGKGRMRMVMYVSFAFEMDLRNAILKYLKR
jgi:hypothetical protein